MSGLPGYDAWKTRSDMDDSDDGAPDNRVLIQCDGCGEMKPDCADLIEFGMDCLVCSKCRGDDQ